MLCYDLFYDSEDNGGVNTHQWCIYSFKMSPCSISFIDLSCILAKTLSHSYIWNMFMWIYCLLFCMQIVQFLWISYPVQDKEPWWAYVISIIGVSCEIPLGSIDIKLPSINEVTVLNIIYMCPKPHTINKVIVFVLPKEVLPCLVYHRCLWPLRWMFHGCSIVSVIWEHDPMTER